MNSKRYKKAIANEYILALRESIANPSELANDRLKEATKRMNRSIKSTKTRNKHEYDN